MTEYRCTRNFLYSDDDLTVRQGHYIHAESEEEAREIMATRYPDEITAGFTVEEWQSFNVTVVEVYRPGGESLAQRVARETGLELIEE